MAYLIIALTIFNLWIYHKVFHVFYFNLGIGIFKEIIGAFIAAIAEMALITWIGSAIFAVLGTIFAVLGTVIVGLMNVIVVLLVLTGVIVLICRIKKKSKKRKTSSQEDNIKEQDVSIDTNTEKIDTSKELMSEKTADTLKESQSMYCVHCGQKVLRSVRFCNFCGKEITYKRDSIQYEESSKC